MTNYFAYGSNMDAAQMRTRCPASVSQGVFRLTGYRFIINGRGVATVTPDLKGHVLGLLWTLTPEDEAALDRYEGVPKGFYRRGFLPVSSELDGAGVEALVYLAADESQGVPRPGYLERILVAGRALQLPPVYVAELERWREPAS